MSDPKPSNGWSELTTLGCALALATLAGAGSVAAQTYPARPVTMIVPLAPGGSTDVIGRIMAEAMRPILGQPVIVDNTAGAGGTIGVGRLARATPDGYTFGIGQWGTNVANGAVYNLPFDLLKDFEPVALIATQPFLVVSRKTMPANNLKELIAWLKANSSKATQGNSGIGSPSHVGGVFFQNAIGVRFQLVPYRSAGLSMQGLVAGDIDVNLDTPAISLPQLQSGNIKAYAVTAKNRLKTAPEIPTTDEAGLPGFHFSFWHAFWAPKGTPKEAVARLNDAVVKSLADPAVRKRLIDLSQDIFPREQLTPEALGAFQKAEIDTWWPIIRAAGVKAE
jgi:tripartite-type tricarboxylate transporter receptor subunit TctC